MVSRAADTRTIPEYVENVVNPYRSKTSKNLKGLMIGGPWVDGIREYIEKNDIKALYLNYARGWSGSDLSFLADLPDIEELNIIAGAVENLAAVELMESLTHLSISAHVRETIDLSKLKKLEKLFLHWWKGAASVFECTTVKNLYIDEVKLKDLAALGNLNELRALTVGNSPFEKLAFVTDLKRLTKLALLNCRKVSDHSPISSLNQLRWLEIRGTKELTSLDIVRSLPQLEVLLIESNSEIASLEPLTNCKKLKAFSFYGSKMNIEDSNLEVLTTLPQLSMLGFRDRRTYSHRLIKPWNWSNFDSPDVLLERRISSPQTSTN